MKEIIKKITFRKEEDSNFLLHVFENVFIQSSYCMIQIKKVISLTRIFKKIIFIFR
jgi:hypothetical protein